MVGELYIMHLNAVSAMRAVLCGGKEYGSLSDGSNHRRNRIGEVGIEQKKGGCEAYMLPKVHVMLG